jgi:endonuclease III
MITETELEKIIKKCNTIRDCLESFLKSRVDQYDVNDFLNKDPLAPIIGTICDEKIKAEVAWNIPYHLYEFLRRQGLEFKASTICKLGTDELRRWLASYMKDKWPRNLNERERQKWLDKISESIVKTCKKIWSEYNDDPDKIFSINNGNLSIPMIYFALRQFPGIGPKKAAMIARDFGKNYNWVKSVKFRLSKRGINLTVTHLHFTEMPIDVHVKRVFRRLGFARYNQPQDFQNLARIIYPENPGLVDDFIWWLGREICKARPNCGICPLFNICEYVETEK